MVGLNFHFSGNISSHARSSQTDSPVPATSPPLEDLDDVPSSSSNTESAYSKARTKELSVWDSLRSEMLRVSFESFVLFAKERLNVGVLNAAALVFVVSLV